MTKSLSIPILIPIEGISPLENIPINPSYLPPPPIEPKLFFSNKTASKINPV